MEAVMASELAQLESRTIDVPLEEAEPEKEDIDFEFNGNALLAQGYPHDHSKIDIQMRRTYSSLTLRVPTKRREQAVTKSGILSPSGIFRKKNGG
jgi:hypothetical protein